MYIIRDLVNNRFKTYDGWTTFNKEGGIEGMDDVQRFTKREAMDHNILPKGQKWVWFGSYSKGGK